MMDAYWKRKKAVRRGNKDRITILHAAVENL